MVPSIRFRRVLFGLALALSLVLSTGCHYRYPYEVEAGRFYRSGQLSRRDLKKTIQDHGIRTVINLRGAQPLKRWYAKEVRLCEWLGVEHHSVDLSSRHIPDRDELVTLLKLFREAPKPILVHCHGGSDRTGLAAALWAMEYMGWGRRHARKQMLSPYFFHFPVFKPAMHYFIRIYDGEDWAENEYDPDSERYDFYESDRDRTAGSAPGSELDDMDPRPDDR